MNTQKRWIAGAALFGALLAPVGITSSAMADGEDGAGVTVGVDIEDAGALTLVVDTDAVDLAESTDAGLAANGLRSFSGVLTGVSVTDTRQHGGPWNVAVQADPDDFVSPDGATISSQYLGWTPRIVGDDADGEVVAGEAIAGLLEDNPDAVFTGGLQQGDLLASSGAGVQGTFQAAADLRLTVADDVTPGAYTSVLTISLFEG